MTDADVEKVAEAALVRKIQSAVDEKVGRDGLTALAPEERVVYLCLWTKGVVDIGGFNYFLTGSYSLNEVGKAFAALGLSTLSDVCRKVVSMFPPDLRTNEERREFIAALPEETADALARPMWRTPYADLEIAIARFVRQRSEVFGIKVV